MQINKLFDMKNLMKEIIMPQNNDLAQTRLVLNNWLQKYTDNLEYFRNPVPYAQIAHEIGLPEDMIREVIEISKDPIYALFRHTFKGKQTSSKPFAIYPCDHKHCLLDWEYPLVTAFEQWFKVHGYDAKQELGCTSDIAALKKGSSITSLTKGSNQRDLWAHEASGNRNNLWIIEAKGKVASEFDFYTFAEGMAQIFSFPHRILQGLLGGGKVAARGHVMDIVTELSEYWTSNGKRMHIGLAVPDFHPTPVWKGGKTIISPTGFYARPLEAFKKFLLTGQTESKTGQYKYQRLFGEMLDYIDKHYNLRAMVLDDEPITFHVITLGTDCSIQEIAITDYVIGKPLQL